MSKKVYLIVTAAVVVILILSGCVQAGSNPPLPTPTISSVDALGPATGSTDDQMAMLEAYATQTAMAASPTPGEVVATTPDENVTPGAEGTAITPGFNLDVTPSPTSVLPPAGTETTPVATTGAVPTVIGGLPSTYTLRVGEFPYCIARRYNIDPEELLNRNGLSDGQLYQPGLILQIPQTGNTFPGTRSLHSHPTTYTVSSAEDTIYRIACYFGDVDPLAIAANNNLVAPYTLQVGQTINIP
ncbi:MAG: LysM peptidoglycan-binding domain-containing protein [Anaerolineales bacterium]|nr:LysM peptidoglycan-binding domain-containing protein [Anaerolineales bacterium]